MEKICAWCNKKFTLTPYRTHSAKFCSRSCSGSFRKKEQYKDKNNFIIKECIVCKTPFQVLNKLKTKNKKTCSEECRNKLQGMHLSQFPKSHKQSVKPPVIKICVQCGKEFILNKRANKRQRCCSPHCGAKQAAFNRRTISKETFENAILCTNSLMELCNKLNCGAYLIYRLEERYGLKYNRRKEEKLRSDGYHQYTNKKNHRRVYENHFNIKLLPKEGIHHIDGDKINSDIDNLFLTYNVGDHARIHGTLQRAAFELFRKGYIKFDKEKRSYYIVEEKIN